MYNATDIPLIKEVTILPISSGLLATLLLTPESAIIKPITVPIKPKITNVLEINLIMFIFEAIFILIELARLLLELASRSLELCINSLIIESLQFSSSSEKA